MLMREYLDEAKAEGKAEGKVEGLTLGIESVTKTMIQNGESDDLIYRSTKLSLERIKQLREKLM